MPPEAEVRNIVARPVDSAIVAARSALKREVLGRHEVDSRRAWIPFGVAGSCAWLGDASSLLGSGHFRVENDLCLHSKATVTRRRLKERLTRVAGAAASLAVAGPRARLSTVAT